MNQPFLTIVIPTRNSARSLGITLNSIKKQNCPKAFYEVVVADNLSTDGTLKIAEKYGARILKVKGSPPRVCEQRNLGAKIAKGNYLFFVDSDVELSTNLIKNFAKKISKKDTIDAWYVPYRIVAQNKFLTKVRNFEDDFYKNSVVAAARIIKKESFWKTENQYDPSLSSGPADWDLNLQLKDIGAEFGYLNEHVYHHEENLTLWQYITKKTNYIEGGEIYRTKWKKKNPMLFHEVVEKQYGPRYRLFGIVMEKGNWKKALKNIDLFLVFLLIKTASFVVYFIGLQRKRILGPVQFK